jgi:F0F1-type ATP synthase membrane subunit a
MMDWSNTSKPRWFGAVFVVILMTVVAIYVTYRNGYPWIAGSLGVLFVAQAGYLYYCDRSNAGRNRSIEVVIGVALLVFVGYVFFVIQRARVHILAGLIFLAYFLYRRHWQNG